MARIPPPVVRYMIVCDDVLQDATRPGKPLIVGLTTVVNALDTPPFPFRLPRLCVFLVLAEGRASGAAWLRIVQDETEEVVYDGPPHRVEFTGGPLQVVGVLFRVLDCPFPAAGHYRVEFWHEDQCLAHQSIEVRAR